MTATLQGSITVDTNTIDKAIERINALNTQLKQITAATVAFEKAYGKGGANIQKQTDALQSEISALKAKNTEQQKSIKIMDNSAKILAQIESKQSKAASTIATLNQRISTYNISADKQGMLIRDLNSALTSYQKEVKDAAGDTAKLTAAKTKLDSRVASARITLNSYNATLDKSNASELSKISALGSLERSFIKSKTAIEGTTLSTKDQQIQIDKLTADYNAATASIKKLGTANVETRKLMQSFSTNMVKQSNNLRNSLKGVGRGAGQAGIQIQQFVGQIQGGVDPMIAFSQQSADLGWALGLPLAGAITGIAFSLGSALVPALFDGTTEVEKFTKALEKLQGLADVTDEGLGTISKGLISLAGKNLNLAKAKIETELEDISSTIDKSVSAIAETLDVSIDLPDTNIGRRGNVIKKQAASFGESLGLAGKEAARYGVLLRNELKALDKTPTSDNIVKFITTITTLKGSMEGLPNDKMKELFNVADELTSLNPKFEALAKLKMTSTAEEFVELAKGINSSAENSKKLTTPLQKLIEKLQTQEIALKDTTQSLQQHTIATMKGTEDERELATTLSASVAGLLAKNKAAELAQKAQVSLNNSIKKMQNDLAIATELNSKGEEAAFKLTQAINLEQKAFSDLSTPIQKQIQDLWDLTAANKAATQGTRDQAKAMRELLAMSAQRPDTTSFSGIDESYNNQIKDAANTFGNTDGGSEAQAAKIAADNKFASDRITSINALNERVKQATQMGNMTEREQLKNDFEQRLAVLKEAYGAEEALQTEHFKTLEKSYKQQDFLTQMAQSADIATGVMQGAMDGLAAYGKQGSKDYQRIAIAQAGIAQVVAQTKIWSEYASTPWVAAGMSAASVAQFAGMISQIKSQSFATGGYVSGAGTATSDSIAANLSNGEYVVKAAAVSKLGTNYLDQVNAGKVPMYSSGGMIGVPTKSDNSGNSWGDLTVQIINEGSSNLEVSNTEQGFDSSGQAIMKVFVREIVREELSQGRLDSTLGKNFGIKRQPVGR